MTAPRLVGGSFRDPAARVYTNGSRILRGVGKDALEHFRALRELDFFKSQAGLGRIVDSRIVDPNDEDAAAIRADGWAGVLEHERLPLISFPYEWTFSMLQDAALLHLDLLEAATAAGWTIKDSTPYNIQFVGTAPVFIDIPSFVPRRPGDYWRGYRQFCMLFLYPLMLKAYRGVNFQPLLRASLDGIPPAEAARLLSGWSRFRRGVPSHVALPAMLERRAEARQARSAGAAASTARPQSDAMVLGLIQSMRRIVGALRVPLKSSTWSDYATSHSYDAASFDDKRAFVADVASRGRFGTVWDLGSNTGTFSELLQDSADAILSVDGDHEAVERLYLRLRQENNRKILPLFMDLANPSPSQGWGGTERAAFDARNRPNLILALALIHHIRLSSNIPISHFLDWTAASGAKLIIEFIDRTDEMVRGMLSRKDESYEDYNVGVFERELSNRYAIIESRPLKGGDRKIYFCEPRTRTQ